MENPEKLMTVAELAERMGMPPARLRYTLRTRKIASDRRAGTTRLYRESRIPELAEAAMAVRPWTTAG